MSLLALSNEILIEIIRQVSPPAVPLGQERYGVRHLALCSKHLNALATPFLYEYFLEGTWKQDQAFARVLLKKPELGDCVKSFTSLSNYYKTSTDEFTFNDDDMSRAQHKLKAFGCKDDEVRAWMEDVKNNHRDAFKALLLLCVPRVKRIEMRCLRGLQMFAVRRIFESAAKLQAQGSDSPFGMKLLTSINVSQRSDDRSLASFGIPLRDVLPLLELNSVTHFDFWHVERNHFQEITDSSSANFAATTLSLNFGLFSHTPLVGLLQGFKKLRKFHYRLAHSKWRDSGERPKDFLLAISHLKHCLEDLTIDTQHSPRPLFSNGFWTDMGSLVEFEKLHTISLTAELLLGSSKMVLPSQQDRRLRLIDMLPKSVKSLQLLGCFPPVLEQLDELLDGREQVVPELSSIRLPGVRGRYVSAPYPSHEQGQSHDNYIAKQITYDEDDKTMRKLSKKLVKKCRAANIDLLFG